MALLPELIEDGTGIPGAISYLNVDDVDKLLAGRPAWDKATEEQKVISLMTASAYADARWANLLSSLSVVNPEQGLTLPLKWPTSINGKTLDPVPRQWKMAIALYAMAEVSGGVWAKKAVEQKDVKMKRVTVGPITTETSYVDGSEQVFVSYPEADMLVRSMLTAIGLSGQGRTIRG